jgi:hypothetical protein
MTDPINSIDASSLPELDRVEIERLRAAYDRGGPGAVAKGMAQWRSVGLIFSTGCCENWPNNSAASPKQCMTHSHLNHSQPSTFRPA